MACRRPQGRSLFPARVSLPDPACRQAQAVLPDRPKGQLVASRRAERPADHGSWLGGLHTGQHFRETRHQRRNWECPYGCTGIEYMIELTRWYQATCRKHSIGFFQIGGGIAGDFPICVVPMLEQSLQIHDIPRWGYFCQISDSTTSYGSYSGAVPNEKIT